MINKELEDLSNIINQLDVTDIVDANDSRICILLRNVKVFKWQKKQCRKRLSLRKMTREIVVCGAGHHCVLCVSDASLVFRLCTWSDLMR